MNKLRRVTTAISLACLLAASLSAPLAVAQQAVTEANANRNRPTAVSTLVGTIEAKAEDDGYLTISGTNYSFDSEVTEVYLRDSLVRASAINEGMSVRFSLDARGTLIRIDILGPFNQIRLRDQH